MESSISVHSEVIAALSMIGGIDSRPRIGGLITSDLIEGAGTVCRVSQSGKLVIQLTDSPTVKKLSLGSCKPVSELQINLEKMPTNDSILDTWASLLCKRFFAVFNFSLIIIIVTLIIFFHSFYNHQH